MRSIVCAALFLIVLTSVRAQEPDPQNEIDKGSKKDYPGTAIFLEAGGKGYGSVNVGFKLKDKHRLSLGLSLTPYTVNDNSTGYGEERPLPTLGFMYYYIKGRNNHFFEVGGGMSSSLRFDLNHTYLDASGEEYTSGMFNAHVVIGYRYQKPNGLLFRAGFTPLFQLVEYLLPIVGVSFGYSF